MMSLISNVCSASDAFQKNSYNMNRMAGVAVHLIRIHEMSSS